MSPIKVPGYTIVFRKKNINGKHVVRGVQGMIHERLSRLPTVGVINNPVLQNVTRLITEYMEDLLAHDKIQAYQIICDQRNNNEDFKQRNGLIAIIVRFRQTNCLTITELLYEMYRNDSN